MNKVKSIILRVFLFFVLSVIAIPVWEYLLQPFLFSLTRSALELVTLGSASLKNGIYVEISKGFHEESSLDLLTLFLGGLIGFLIGVVASFYSVRPTKKVTISDMLRSRIVFALSFYFLFLTILASMFLVPTRYVNDAVTHFHQLCAIVSPYMEDTEKEKYASRFAQIQKKEDYSKLISDLESIASKNKLTIPKFEIW